MPKHKVLSYEQLSINRSGDRAVPLDEGLDRLLQEGWELITTYPSRGYGFGFGATTMFVFRRIKV